MKANFNNKVVYQIYPKSYKDSNGDGIGDIKGIISKLDYLKELGVDYIWLSPINESPQYDNGYDISNYYEIDPIFGTKDDYKTLIEEAKKRDIFIMLDLVLNHVSSESEWFKKAISGDKKYYDYFIWRDEPNELMSFFTKPAWTYNEQVGKYYFHLFDKHQPDLNWENPQVREEIYKMVNYWIDFGVRGFRLDVIDLIGKEPDKLITGKGPKFYEYLEELHLNTFKDDILTVGECWNSSLEDSHKMCDQNGLSQVFHFTEQIITGEGEKWNFVPIDLNKLGNIIKSWNNDYDGLQTKVMDNHDLPRLLSIWLNDKEYRYEGSTLLVTLFSLFKGTLYLYQGDEIGMTNDDKNDISLYNDVESLNKYEVMINEEGLTKEEAISKIKLISRDNARTPMQWDDSEFGGFSTSKPWINMNYRYKEINVKNDFNSEKSIYKYYSNIIKYRKENYDNIVSQKVLDFKVEDEVLYFERETFKMYFNFSTDEKKLNITGELILSNYKEASSSLRAQEVKIVSK